MRQLRVLRAVGSVAVAALSWLLAERLTSSALGHRHVLAGGGAAVSHLHGSAVLLAAASVLMASLAGVLVIALATGAGRQDPSAAGGGVRSGAAGRRRRGAAARGAMAAVTGVTMGLLAVLDAIVQARGGPGLVPHPGVLVLVALVQAVAAGMTQLLWQWCVDVVWAWGRRHALYLVPVRVADQVFTARDVGRPAGRALRVARGRGPPPRVLSIRRVDLLQPLVPTLT